MKCVVCGKDIENGDLIYQLRLGSIETDNDNCTGFDEGSYLTDQYIHFGCLKSNRSIINEYRKEISSPHTDQSSLNFKRQISFIHANIKEKYVSK